MRIGVVAAEAAFASFARSIDFDEVAAGDLDFEGSIGAADWPVFRLVLDTLAAPAGQGDTRTLDERRADALNDLARICLAAKNTR
ncbi:13E12 repeat family protein [Actinomadura sp. HBU206391]|uniref:13E12 repeat family protein n=1 Tax=Actinomadura sp. HBU206391 TaxID=2731692 RepID=UPI0021C8726B|nr:13E12 repeat family protein [Actinomadura sp. HBU206391]